MSEISALPTSRLEGREPAGLVAAIPVRAATIRMTQDTTQTGRLILVLTTMTGAKLAFSLPEGAVDQLTDGVWEAMRATRELDWLN